jgi:hypothetical protein
MVCRKRNKIKLKIGWKEFPRVQQNQSIIEKENFELNEKNERKKNHQ